MRYHHVWALLLGVTTPALADSTNIVCHSVVSSYIIMHEWRYHGANSMLNAATYFVRAGKCAIDAQSLTSVGEVFSVDYLPGFPGDPKISVIVAEVKWQKQDSFAIFAFTP